jgi:cobalt-zinc-cadmium efflux system membrane fusion protein
MQGIQAKGIEAMRSKAFLLAVGAFAAGALVGALIEHKTELIRYLRGLGGPRDVSDANARSGTEGGDLPGGNGGAAQVLLTDHQANRAGIQTRPATFGPVRVELELAGEISANQDRLTRITSRVPGVVKEVRKNLGDMVAAGEVVAVIESRELADAKLDYLAAETALCVAQADSQHLEELWRQKACTEHECLVAQQAVAREQLRLRGSRQKLQALGLSAQELACLVANPDEPLTFYSVVAPLQGTVVERHIAVGEPVDQTPLLTVADLRTVWVLGGVPEKDMLKVGTGQAAVIETEAFPETRLEGEVAWVSSTLDEGTRMLPIRVEVDNTACLLKPGMLARIFLTVETKQDAFAVPREALCTYEDSPVVFVDCGRGRYQMRPVRVGLQSCAAVEILDGVHEGEPVVTGGNSVLLSELEKGCVAGG